MLELGPHRIGAGHSAWSLPFYVLLLQGIKDGYVKKKKKKKNYIKGSMPE